MDRPTTVLVADDQAAARENTARILREMGFRVVACSDGQDALEKAASERPDLLVLDVVMPRVTGLDVCRSVKRAAAGDYLPVLLVSAKGDTTSRVEGLRAGADDFLSKPFDPDELRARAEALLRTRRAFEDAVRRAAANAASDEMGLTDRLTGLYNQRYLTQRLEEEFQRAERYNEPLALLAVDLDEFERVNRQAGRALADRLLAECGRTLTRVSRQIDIVTRAGEDEFALILPNTHFAGSLTFAERVWREVRATAVDGFACDASVGVACYPNRDVTHARDLLRFCHAALARAKAEGRGKICLYQHQGYLFQPGS